MVWGLSVTGSGKYGYTGEYRWNTQIFDFNHSIYHYFDEKHFIVKSGEAHKHRINISIALSPKLDRFAVGTDTGSLNIFKINKINDIQHIKSYSLKEDSIITSLVYSENGNTLISTGMNSIKFWNVENDSLMETINTPNIRYFIESKKVINNQIILKYIKPEINQYIYVRFNVKTKEFLDSVVVSWALYPGHFIDDNIRNIVYTKNKVIYYKNMIDTMEYEIIDSDYHSSLDFTEQTDKYLIYGKKDSLIYFCNKSDGEFFNKINVGKSPIKTLKVSPDRQKLLVVIDNYFQIWDTERLTKDIEILINDNNHYEIAPIYTFSLDSKSFWVVRRNNYVTQYSCENGKILNNIIIGVQPLRYIKSIAFSNNERLLTLGSMLKANEFVFDLYNLNFNNVTASSQIFKLPNVTSINNSFINDSTILVDFDKNSNIGFGMTYNYDNQKIVKTFELPEQLMKLKTAYKITKIKDQPFFILNSNTTQFWLYGADTSIAKYTSTFDYLLSNVEIDDKNGYFYTFGWFGARRCYKLGTDIATLDIENDEHNNINNLNDIIFPNPVTDYLQIKAQDIIGQFEIYNTIGEVIIKDDIKESINVSGLNSGLYFIKIGNKISKFIKK